VAGYDAEPAEITLLRQGVINILVIQNPPPKVPWLFRTLLGADGDKSMIKKSVLLPNVVATTQHERAELTILLFVDPEG